MPGKIFVNYRRDDVPGDARGVRDGLAAKFGRSNVFMDVDNLLVGQRFDLELAKALDACDMLIAVIGPRWMDLLKVRMTGGERDYVREEIAEALRRRILVIPVRVGREGQMPTMPRPDELPEDIRELVLYQKHDVAHERFGRDMADLNESIVAVRKSIASGERPAPVRALPWRWIGASAAATLAVAYVGAYSMGVPLPGPSSPSVVVAKGPDLAAEAKARSDDVERLRVAAAKADDDRKRAVSEAAMLRAEAETRRKADEAERQRLAALKIEDDRARLAAAAKRKAEEEVVAKRKADDDARARAAADAERQRLVALKVEEDRQRAAAEAKRKAEEEAARRDPPLGQTFRDCNDGCPEMVVVPAGTFMMGEGSRQRRTSIPQPFAVGKFEVTFAEWEVCAAGGGCTSNKSPSDQGWGKGKRPVINVSWNDAKEYVAWLSRKTGKTYRLLTEAEWEYAARAGTTTAYWWGDKFDGSKAKNGSQTVPVGQYAANAFGLHDMHGNVWEWCEDAYDASSRVLRGGAWGNFPDNLRSAVRYGGRPTDRNYVVGFRLARTL